MPITETNDLLLLVACLFAAFYGFSHGLAIVHLLRG